MPGDQCTREGWRYFFKFVIIIGFLISILLLFFYLLPLRFNLSSSMPIGIYTRLTKTTIRDGDLVAVCLPQEIAQEGRRKGYLLSGQCAAHAKPVLKEVIAVPGDDIRLNDFGMEVNQKFYSAPQLPEDHNHLKIRRWTKNKIYHPRQSIWLYGANDPVHSWDSRYFGGISIKNVLGIYRKIWVVPAESTGERILPGNSAVQTAPQHRAKPNSHLARAYFPSYFPLREKFPDHPHTTSEGGQEPNEK